MKTSITLAVLTLGLLTSITQIAQANVRSNFFLAQSMILTDLTEDRTKHYVTAGNTLGSASVIDASLQVTRSEETATNLPGSRTSQ